MFKVWRPKNPKAVLVVKLTLWAAVLTWMVFFLGLGIIMAKRLGDAGPDIYWALGNNTLAQVLTWVAPIWVVFTVILLAVYVAKYANKKLRP